MSNLKKSLLIEPLSITLNFKKALKMATIRKTPGGEFQAIAPPAINMPDPIGHLMRCVVPDRLRNRCFTAGDIFRVDEFPKIVSENIDLIMAEYGFPGWRNKGKSSFEIVRKNDVAGVFNQRPIA